MLEYHTQEVKSETDPHISESIFPPDIIQELFWILPTSKHIWELPVNYPVFTVVMVIYHYVERIWKIIVTPDFLYNIYDHG